MWSEGVASRVADLLGSHDLLCVAGMETLPALERWRLVQGVVSGLWGAWSGLPRVPFELDDAFFDVVWGVVSFVGGDRVVEFLLEDEAREGRLLCGEAEPDEWLLM